MTTVMSKPLRMKRHSDLSRKLYVGKHGIFKVSLEPATGNHIKNVWAVRVWFHAGGKDVSWLVHEVASLAKEEAIKRAICSFASSSCTYPTYRDFYKHVTEHGVELVERKA